MDCIQYKRKLALEKELLAVEKQEQKMEQAAQRAKPAGWKSQLESRIPPKVYDGLEIAFCRGFSMVFEQGRTLIEKSYKKEELWADHAIRDYAVQLKGGRKELKQLQKSAQQSEVRNMAVTAAGGIGLGLLGIGMPDIMLFLGTLLKGIYETALHYGYDYETRRERYLILKMMEAALSSGEERREYNRRIDEMLAGELPAVTERELELQIRRTASMFAMDMLLLKFVQGLPIVGIIGGAANPVYYRRVMKYVRLKYQKRYLLGWKARE